MRTSRELRRLRKQMSIDQRQREIGVRLPLDNNSSTDTIVADRQMLYSYVEVVRLAARPTSKARASDGSTRSS
jgi:hypothetical protein